MYVEIVGDFGVDLFEEGQELGVSDGLCRSCMSQMEHDDVHVVRQDSQAGDGDNNDEIDRLDSGRQAFEALKASGGFDDVLARIDAGELQLTGEGGFLQEMVKAVLERGLQTELSSHLGYGNGTRPGGYFRTSATALAPRRCPARSVM